jgi:hypothetical protein
MARKLLLKTCAVQTIAVVILLSIIGCGLEREGYPDQEQGYQNISQVQKDYIERFNVIAKDIRDFPKPGKDLEKYFYIWKSVANLDDATILIFGEHHAHSANRLWSAGVINQMVAPNDVILFEGAKGGLPVDNISEYLVTNIFAAREFEKFRLDKLTKKGKGKEYGPDSLSKILNKFWALFHKTKRYLALNIFKFNQGRGYFWDLIEGNKLHPDPIKRNEAMVNTIKDKLAIGARVFVIAGASHTPLYEFASALEDPLIEQAFLRIPGAKADEINDTFYNCFPDAKTKVIFDFLKGRDFAVLIPRNLPGAQQRTNFPKNAK